MADDILSQKKVEESRISQTSLRLDYLFTGVDLVNRVIVLDDSIECPIFTFVDAALSEFERSSKKRITIKINSCGGSVYDALAVVGRIKRSSCDIVIEVYGAAMSAATLIAACGDIRRMSRYAFIMHHSSSYSISGRHTEVTAAVAQAEREERLWAKWMESFTNESESYWYETGKHVDSYFTAQEALELGIIDEII